MSRREPTKEEEAEFWAILRASAPLWDAVELDRLASYYLRTRSMGSEDSTAIVESAFGAFSQSPREIAPS